MLDIQRDSGMRYYAVPLIIIGASIVVAAILSALFGNLAVGLVAYGIWLGVYTAVSLTVFMVLCLMWIGVDSLGLSLLNVAAAAAATAMFHVAWTLIIPVGGLIQSIAVFLFYASVLAKLADIDWGEAMIVGLLTNVIFAIIFIVLLTNIL